MSGTERRQDEVTDLIDSLLGVFDPILGPDLSISTADGAEGLEIEIFATITDRPALAAALADRECPHIVTADEDTSHCALAEQGMAALRAEREAWKRDADDLRRQVGEASALITSLHAEREEAVRLLRAVHADVESLLHFFDLGCEVCAFLARVSTEETHP